MNKIQKILRSKKIIFLEILLLFMFVGSNFYPWNFNYSLGIIMFSPLIGYSFLFLLIGVTILAMIEKNKFILISNAIIFLLTIVLLVGVEQYVRQFWP